jgi:hypothetical protein
VMPFKDNLASCQLCSRISGRTTVVTLTRIAIILSIMHGDSGLQKDLFPFL